MNTNKKNAEKMKNKITFKRVELPQQWIDEAKRSSYRERLISIEDKLNNDIKEQIETEGLEFGLTLINKMRGANDAIRVEMNKAYLDYTKTLKFIPKAEMQRVKQSFDDIANRLESINIWLFNQLQSIPIKLVERKGLIVFDLKEVEQHIETIGIRTFTDTDREYVKLLNEATETLVKVRNFEIENGFAEYSTKALHVIPSLMKGLAPMFVACGLSTDATQGIVNLQYIINNTHRILVDQ